MHQGRLDPRRLVFLDETWAKTNMTRRHGHCARGARLVAKVPHGRWRTVTFLAALRHDRIAAPCVIDGPINGASFCAYIEQFLVPTLSPGDIIRLRPRRLSTRLTVAGETLVSRAICLPVQRWRRSTSIRSAVAVGVGR